MSGSDRMSGKASRFAVVGVANTIIDIAVFAALTQIAVQPLFANLLAWVVAVSFSYWANSRWSFVRSTDVSEGRSILRFISTGALISLGVSSGAIGLLSDLIGVWPAKLLGVAAAAVLNFIAARWSIENKL